GIIVWDDGAPVYAYGRDLHGPPRSDWDVMNADALTYRMLEAGRTWAVQLVDGDNQAHLEWRGASSPISYASHPEGPLPRSVTWGHYEQPCRVTGDLILAGERVTFDGFGQRDHAWGFRHWAELHSWHWISGSLTDGRAFSLVDVLDHHSVRTVHGYVLGPDGPSFVVAADRFVTRSEDGAVGRFRLLLTTEDGAMVAVEGEGAGGSIPVRPAGDQLVVVRETPVRVTIDGADGYGIYEQLVTEFD